MRKCVLCLLIVTSLQGCIERGDKEYPQIDKDKKSYNVIDTIRVLKLENPKGEYTVIDIRDSNRRTRLLQLADEYGNKSSISINYEDYSGFSVDELKETHEGFLVSIEYGSIIYNRKTFYFIFKDNTFYLQKIHSSWFDKHQPNDFFESDSVLNTPVKWSSVSFEDFMR
ncbi:hypothetical protein ABS768_00960 [Flavobacterium sp. ST-75]|uniref:Lipoprotein n=1 Tax=Flavobacterium rhizophilum TaxID=3163296 RepID=A0ABW8Y766_9FLAO